VGRVRNVSARPLTRTFPEVVVDSEMVGGAWTDCASIGRCNAGSAGSLCFGGPRRPRLLAIKVDV
jgi:hypothetical protein